jgi:1-acyl-sn-glycerol-3-phosphate acyltransferase
MISTRPDSDSPPAATAHEGAPPEGPISWREAWTAPLPHAAGRFKARLVMRTLMALWGRQVLAVRGFEHVRAESDPFILALNHTNRLEALLVPTWLILRRGGKLIHFFADWNFLLWPVVGTIIRTSEAIIVTRKDARPRWLNRLKPRFTDPLPPFERARRRLAAGAAIGIFPEGTVNRDPHRMLPGQMGAARLSLETGVPVVPAGIRFPRHRGPEPVSDWEKMELVIGAPLQPPAAIPAGEPSTDAVREWHARIMTEISRLCGKEWHPHSLRRKYVA